MKRLTILAALTLSACTPTEMVAIAQDECAKIGYRAGTPEYVACTERGFRTVKQQQDEAVADLIWWAAIEAAY